MSNRFTERELEEKECSLYCEQAEGGEPEVCKRICLAQSAAQHSVYHQALIQAKKEGLTEADAHIFAAGYVACFIKYVR